MFVRLCAGVFLTLLLVDCGGGAPTAGGDGLRRMQARGVLRWGGDVQGGEPYVFEDPAHPGRYTGFEVEIAAALARQLGVRAEFVQNDWSTLIPSLERGTFDIALNGIEVTPARQARVRLTRPYHVFAERLVARASDAGGRVRDLGSLRGLRVGTLASSLAWDMLGEAGAERIPYEGVEEPFIDLANGRIDAVLIDDIIAARYGARPGLAVVGDVGKGQYAIGVRRDEEALFRAVDDAVAKLADSGELAAILARWKLLGQEKPGAGPGATGGSQRSTAGSSSESTRRRFGAHHLRLFLEGAGVTLLVSTLAMSLAVLGGLLLALARLPAPSRRRKLARWAATAYVEIFRGTPVLLQLFVIYYGLAGVLALDAYTAAIVGLGLNYAAYEAEIYRAGIQAVPRGEIEAAQALGMSGPMAFRRVVLPQALRFSLPGMANDFIALLKDSALVSVITVVELTKRMTIAAVELGDWVVPAILCALLYLMMSYPLSRLARRLEARLSGERS